MAQSGPSMDSALPESPRRSEHIHFRDGEDEESSERQLLRDIERDGTHSTSTWSSENALTSRSTTTHSNDFAPQRQETTGHSVSETDSIVHDPGASRNNPPAHSTTGRVSFQPIVPSSSNSVESAVLGNRTSGDLEDLASKQLDIPSHRQDDPPQMPNVRDIIKNLRIRAIIVGPKNKESLENIIIVLHDRSGNEKSLKDFASKHLQPRGTACLLVGGITPMEGKEYCYQWEENLDSFLKTSWLILHDLISNVLMRQCNFPAHKIILFGQGEGAMAALAAFLTWKQVKFGGVICVGGQLPSLFPLPDGPKSKTAVLLLGGALGVTTNDAKSRIEQQFSYVDCNLMNGKDDSLPRDQQLESLREFFAHRLHEHEWVRPAIITFDGGGIRGYGSLLILQALMNKIGALEKKLDPQTNSSFYPCAYKPKCKNKLKDQKAGAKAVSSLTPDSESSAIPVATSTDGLPNSSLFLPCHYFQYAGGTSTGGLISIMISRLRMTVDDCIKEYKALGGDVFGKPRLFTLKTILWDKFDCERLEKVIEDVTFRHSDASHVTKKWPSPEDLSRTTVVAYNDKGTSDDPYLIRTFETYPGHGPGSVIRRASSTKTLNVRNHGLPQDMNIPQVGRATTAAPGYFRHLTVQVGGTTLRFKDGGFGCNNPSWEIYRDVLALLVNGSKDMGPFISIGTGISDVVLFPAARQSRLKHKIAEFKAATKGLPTRTKGTHENMLTVAHRDGRERFPYMRFDGGGDLGGMAMDEWKPNDRTGTALFTGRKHKYSGRATLRKIEDAMSEYLARKDVQDDLEAYARILVKRRRLQMRDESRWDRFASASFYICPYKRCPRQRHNTLEEYKAHVRRRHPQRLSEEQFDARVQRARRCWLYGDTNGDVTNGDVTIDDPESSAEDEPEVDVVDPVMTSAR